MSAKRDDFFNSSDKGGLRRQAARFIEYGLQKGDASKTSEGRRKRLKQFIAWRQSHGIKRACQVDRRAAQAWQNHLTESRNGIVGERLQPVTVHGLLSQARSFFRWLAEEKEILYNPFNALTLPKVKAAHKEVLTENEVETLFSLPNLNIPTGIRNRAVLELLYATGVRAKELLALTLWDLEIRENAMRVEGKRQKQRLVPLGERASHWIETYLDKARPKLRKDVVTDHLFLSRFGRPMDYQLLSAYIIRPSFKKAGIKKRGGSHLFRHTMASVMLKNGADIREVQMMLGHAKIKTTQIYTHLDIEHLKAVHRKYHPAETGADIDPSDGFFCKTSKK